MHKFAYKLYYMCISQKTPLTKKITEEDLFKSFSQKHQQLSDFLLRYVTDQASHLAPERANLTTASFKELIRITGGIPALKGEFNECCLIGVRNPNGTTEWFCTGVLIYSQLIVTAAHCIKPGRGYVVALQTNSQNYLSDAEFIPVRKAVIHPQYSSIHDINDISVLVLQHPSQTPPIRFASTQEINVASEVMLVGFGNDDIHSTRGFGLKRKVEVDMVSIRRDINENLNDEEALYGYESDLEFVAGGKGFDTCNGDSGGPAYIINDNERIVAGLTSRATANARNPCGDGGVYTRLDVHADFIHSFNQH